MDSICKIGGTYERQRISNLTPKVQSTTRLAILVNSRKGLEKVYSLNADKVLQKESLVLNVLYGILGIAWPISYVYKNRKNRHRVGYRY